MTPARIQQLLRDQIALTRDHHAANRFPLEVDERPVGSVTLADAQLIAGQVAGVMWTEQVLSVRPVCSPDAPAVFDAIAQTLRAAGRTGRWRNEKLPVLTDDGSLVGAIERACARRLGIRTIAVHLVGMIGPTQAGELPQALWLQRRAADKDVDPGRLDTLAGGLVGMSADGRAMEDLPTALAREVHEEAGLSPGQYARPRSVGSWRAQRHLPEGWMVEDMIIFRSHLDPDTTPVNRDGEVSEFIRVDRDSLGDRIEAGELTIAAAIATLMSLQDMLNGRTA